MHIWVDGQCFQTPSASRGIGRYVIEFLAALNLVDGVTISVSLNANLEETLSAARYWLTRYLPGARIHIWHGTTQAYEIHHGITDEHYVDAHILAAHVNFIAPDVALSASLFEGEYGFAVPLLDASQIDALTSCIFYDAIPYRFPAAYLPNEAAMKVYMRRLEAIRTYDLVLAISEFSASEYIEILQGSNVINIGTGLPQNIRKLIDATPNSDLDILPKYVEQYVFYVGGRDWRKNLAFVVRALAKMPEARSGELTFVIAGQGDEGDERIRKQLEAQWAQLGLPPQGLVFLGFVSDEQLLHLYRGALTTVQPSLMEGFGLSVLEAMAAGSPVLASPGGAVAEVLGDPDALFSPTDTDDFVQKLRRLMSDDALRSRMAASGVARASQFNWTACADRAVEGFRAALDCRGISFKPLPEQVRLQHPRIVMDVTTTTLSRAHSGIQRVMKRTTASMLELYKERRNDLAFSFCSSKHGLFEVPRIDKGSIDMSSDRKLVSTPRDLLLYLDSSWIIHQPMRDHVKQALLEGKEVVHGVYDLGPVTMSALTSSGMPPVFASWVKYILGHSTGLLCISQAVADEVYALVQAIKLPRPMKIGYFRLGSDFSDVEGALDWLSFVGGRKTFLMVGTIEPRKGHHIALAAFEQLWRQGHDVNLLIVGKPGWNIRLLLDRLNVHPERDRRLFVRTGVSDAELSGAYQIAEALIMTSYLEGFGLPVAEAGRLGCPVIAPDLPVFREVGDSAPSIKFFRSGDVAALLNCIEEALVEPMPRGHAGSLSWPNWLESAREIEEVLVGGNWYKQYVPETPLPTVSFGDIGHSGMRSQLGADQMAAEMRIIEGPLLSDEAPVVWFTVAVKNCGDAIWSSSGAPDGRYAVNVGIHVYDRDGACLIFDLPREPIPLFLSPGEELLVPIRVPLEWLARGGHFVGVELVQEGIAWFGQELRVDLCQPSDVLSDRHVPGNVEDLKFQFVRSVPVDDSALLMLFVVFNVGANPVRIDDEAFSVIADAVSQDGTVVASGFICSRVERLSGNGYGLLAVTFDRQEEKDFGAVSITLDGGDVSANWRVDLTAKKPAIASSENRGPVSLPKVSLDVDSYDDTDDESFINIMYHTILARSADPEGVGFYKWALSRGRLNRVAAARRIAFDNSLADLWDIWSRTYEDRSSISLRVPVDASAGDVIAAFETQLGSRVPEPARSRWLDGEIDLGSVVRAIEADWGGFHARVVLDGV